jgi:alpha-1,6-mannosyltransferase
VPFGIDKQIFSPELASKSRRDELIERCNMASDTPLLVAVGRHHPEKRLATLIEAVRIASQTRPIAFVLFGDGPLRAFVERRAARVRGVHVAGHVADRVELARGLASADAMLHGSSAETYGISVAEAICSGLGLIVADRGGAADLARIEFSETYAAGDSQDCARAILRFLSRDRQSIRAAAQRAAASQVLDIDAHFQQLFNLYSDKLEASTPLAR